MTQSELIMDQIRETNMAISEAKANIVRLYDKMSRLDDEYWAAKDKEENNDIQC